jgi:hypothetical protein
MELELDKVSAYDDVFHASHDLIPKLRQISSELSSSFTCHTLL